MPTRNIEVLIQRQMHHWSRWREMMELEPEPQKRRPRPIITISREMGSGERVLARALAERLDLEVHGYSLIDEIARDRNLERRIVAQLDERTRGEIELWVQSMLNRRLLTNEQYYVSLVKAVRTLAAHGGVVIVGRGAHIILADTCALRVRLVASLENRVQNLADFDHIDEEAARSRIVESDAARDTFLKKMFGVDANDPHLYDLVINTDRMPLPRVVEIVMATLEVRGAFST